MIVKAETQTLCTHCGLPVPAGLIEPDRAVQFCCGGCAGAYQLIHDNGLESFYHMAANSSEDLTLQGHEVPEQRFAEYDQPVFLEKYATSLPSSESRINLALEGIHCGACVWLIEKLPMMLPGVSRATVNWTKRTVTVEWRPEEVKLSQIAGTLNRLGYHPCPLRAGTRENQFQQENRRHLIRIGIAAAAAGNNMIISIALYLGMFSHMTMGMSHLLRVASCVVGLAALLWPGRIFLRSAWNALRTRTPHMDLPIAIALTLGTLAGLINVLRGAGEIYFDSLSVLIFLLLIGRWIQFRQQSKAASAVELLYRLTPQMTRKLVDGKPLQTLVDLVEVDDRLEIRPGELFPVDGIMERGTTRVDQSILTGESDEVAKAAGDNVSAGTTNLSSTVIIQAQAVGSETRLSRIVELVEKASLEKPAAVLWANQIGGYFVAAVTLLALATLGWWLPGGIDLAVDRTIALLIVACPCALALATPLAIAVAIGRAARQKIMIKGGDVLQSTQQPGQIWLDKTGTLTDGKLQVAFWMGDPSWIRFAAALENQSSHPVAKAIFDYASQRLLDGFPSNYLRDFGPGSRADHLQLMLNHPNIAVVSSVEIPGKGIHGQVGEHQVVIGNQGLMADFGISIARRHQRIAERLIARGLSPCWLAIDQVVVSIIGLGDSIRAEAPQAIQQLQQLGWKVGILSGDHQSVVDRVATRLHIDSKQAFGGVSPERKLEVIEQSGTQETVVMVGDGVNDSAALAAANVGIAVKNGAETSLAAAPVYLADPGLNPILNLIAIGQSTKRIMQINLAFSLTYNLVCAGLAFIGLINPLVAAILMPISSLTVVAMSLGAGKTPQASSDRPGLARAENAHSQVLPKVVS